MHSPNLLVIKKEEKSKLDFTSPFYFIFNLNYFPTTFNAVSTTFSTVNPNSLNNVPAGADAPK